MNRIVCALFGGVLLAAGGCSTAEPVRPGPDSGSGSGSGARVALPGWGDSCGAPAEGAGFSDWQERLEQAARRAGLRPAALEALQAASLDSSILERDQAQPEFERPIWEYLNSAISDSRVSRGRTLLTQHQGAFARVTSRFGVPPEYVAAIWGIESAYGAAAGSTPVVEALMTLAYGGRRRAWACEELAAALTLLDRGVPRGRLIGSWAGATGQTQFLPSKILAFGVDDDRNGQIDLWSSLGDVFASTANYLKEHGWRADQPWGVEVTLPPGFDFALADPAAVRPVSAWMALGVTAAPARRLPAGSLQGAIILPAGYRGPAFLILENFRVIMKYNYATSYALAVSLLADRLAGRPGVSATWPVDQRPLRRSEREALQSALEQRGYPVGGIDGVIGAQTQGAIRRYQKDHGLPADGFANQDILARLLSGS